MAKLLQVVAYNCLLIIPKSTLLKLISLGDAPAEFINRIANLTQNELVVEHAKLQKYYRAIDGNAPVEFPNELPQGDWINNVMRTIYSKKVEISTLNPGITKKVAELVYQAYRGISQKRAADFSEPTSKQMCETIAPAARESSVCLRISRSSASAQHAPAPAQHAPAPAPAQHAPAPAQPAPAPAQHAPPIHPQLYPPMPLVHFNPPIMGNFIQYNIVTFGNNTTIHGAPTRDCYLVNNCTVLLPQYGPTISISGTGIANNIAQILPSSLSSPHLPMGYYYILDIKNVLYISGVATMRPNSIYGRMQTSC